MEKLIDGESAARPKVVELFAGVGGFRLGLEDAGFETVLANQWEPSTRTQHAFDCYSRNFGESENNLNLDIAKVTEICGSEGWGLETRRTERVHRDGEALLRDRNPFRSCTRNGRSTQERSGTLRFGSLS